MVFGVAEWIPTNQQRDAIGIFRMCHPIDQTAAISAVASRHSPGSTEGDLGKFSISGRKPESRWMRFANDAYPLVSVGRFGAMMPRR
jgi:hypothetical protein